MSKVLELIELVKQSNNIVVFTGAGISTESDIPDFRSNSGLYASGKYKDYKPEQILSRKFFFTNKEIFFSFYRDRLLSLCDKQPNRSHYALVKLEEIGKLKWVVTQNIDNLHQKAGSKNVLDLHGNGSKCHCISCYKKFTFDEFCVILNSSDIPRCDCGGIVRPSTVLFDECLNDDVYDKAYYEIKKADLLISIGSSLVVQPAAGLLSEKSKECKLVIINNSDTPYDKKADLVINENCGDVLENLIKNI